MSGGPRQLFDPEASPQADEVAHQVDDGTHPDVMSVGGLYDSVESALSRAFPRNRGWWVRGEISHLSDHRSGHLFFDLVDPEDQRHGVRPRSRGGVPTLSVKCWRTTWAPLRHRLGKAGIELAEGMVVVVRGTVDLYRARGEINLSLIDVDVTALLGRLAAQRTQLLRTLEAEGLLRANARIPQPDLPLHVGLVASAGTEGCRDFLGQLTGSGFGFHVSHVKVGVQGPGAPASIARALTMLSRSDCDVVAVVRGGGARSDLAAFETEVVARAVARCTKPVLTGIGHSGDETVADVVAARACITPTECGQHLVVAARRWWSGHVAEPAKLLASRVPTFLAAAETGDSQMRRHLTAVARNQLRVHRDRLGVQAGALSREATSCVDAREARLRSHAARVGPLSESHLSRQDEHLHTWRRLLVAYDVDRQLERGYSLTLTTDGSLVRSGRELALGQEIVTRFADGTVRSRVEATELKRED